MSSGGPAARGLAWNTEDQPEWPDRTGGWNWQDCGPASIGRGLSAARTAVIAADIKGSLRRSGIGELKIIWSINRRIWHWDIFGERDRT
jgi:hypothetical protein